jgi:hypothetical protein
MTKRVQHGQQTGLAETAVRKRKCEKLFDASITPDSDKVTTEILKFG